MRGGRRENTYHGPLERLCVLLELPQGILLSRGALDDGGDPVLSDVFQDGLHLVGGGGVFGDVELELGAGLLGVRLDAVVTGLVLSRAGGSVGRHLLEDVGGPHRGGGARLVEEGDNVEGLVLEWI